MKNTVPSPATHPNTFAWWVLVHRFSDAIRNSWAGAQPAAAKGGDKKATPAPAKKEEAPKKKDDDDMDLFGDDDEDDAVSFPYSVLVACFSSTRYLIGANK